MRNDTAKAAEKKNEDRRVAIRPLQETVYRDAEGYALYQAEVTLEGYFDQNYFGIPVFDGITAIQPAILIPLPENGTNGIPRPDGLRVFENSTADL